MFKLSESSLKVLMSLISRHGNNGKINPSQRTIAEDVGSSERWVRRILANLSNASLNGLPLLRITRKHRANSLFSFPALEEIWNNSRGITRDEYLKYISELTKKEKIVIAGPVMPISQERKDFLALRSTQHNHAPLLHDVHRNLRRASCDPPREFPDGTSKFQDRASCDPPSFRRASCDPPKTGRPVTLQGGPPVTLLNARGNTRRKHNNAQQDLILGAGLQKKSGVKSVLNKQVHAVLCSYYDQYRLKYGVAPYVDWGGKDKATATKLLLGPPVRSTEELIRLISQYMALEDTFLVDAGYPFSLLPSKVNRLTTMVPVRSDISVLEDI